MRWASDSVASTCTTARRRIAARWATGVPPKCTTSPGPCGCRGRWGSRRLRWRLVWLASALADWGAADPTRGIVSNEAPADSADIGEQPPRSPLLASVRALGAALDGFDDAAAAALGVGRSDLRALNLLEDGPLPAGVIANRLHLTTGAVTALINRLVVAGYVERQTSDEDGRRVIVRLRPTTYAAFARVYAPCGRAVDAIASDLSTRQSAAAARALAHVTGALLVEADKLRGGGASVRSESS